MSIDLDTIIERSVTVAKGEYLVVNAEDFNALIAEVERLRDEADEMRRWAEEAAHAENLNALDAQKERAAVVKWLRRMGYVGALDIERGEHRREEVP